MTRRAITPKVLPSELPVKFAYSYAVRQGNELVISGLVSVDAEGRVKGVNDARQQADQIFANLAAVCEAADVGIDDVIETTTYCTDRSYLAAINDARVQFFTGPVKPTSTLVVVAGLARPEFLVEISARAVVLP
ncbi:RidA family protein [Sinosporangium siamense]|uniref:Translation initiation inhibitor n=1 Tax=Sinosporangium siamense TaxID=1367973 RepID=A0A919RHI6_9ACTN|nr:RidA family protein [Sinosporangium siamense]GII92915.1 translation initiation inhibitor [Sinosporangium siamense]